MVIDRIAEGYDELITLQSSSAHFSHDTYPVYDSSHVRMILTRLESCVLLEIELSLPEIPVFPQESETIDSSHLSKCLEDSIGLFRYAIRLLESGFKFNQIEQDMLLVASYQFFDRPTPEFLSLIIPF
ncbi:MAG: hypothetical protein ACFFEF_08660 [Candidatus Thorarchaeota archaeon]